MLRLSGRLWGHYRLLPMTYWRVSLTPWISLRNLWWRNQYEKWIQSLVCINHITKKKRGWKTRKKEWVKVRAYREPTLFRPPDTLKSRLRLFHPNMMNQVKNWPLVLHLFCSRQHHLCFQCRAPGQTGKRVFAKIYRNDQLSWSSTPHTRLLVRVKFSCKSTLKA